MNIKTRILLSVFLLELIGYGLLLFYSNQTAKTTLIKVRNEQIQAIISSNFYRINNLTALLEHKASDLAKTGEMLYNLKTTKSSNEIEASLTRFLVGSITNFPDAIGGGLWYEPEIFEPGKTYYGPYVFWNAQKKVEFTWDLNTAEYDYHRQSWYLKALPRDWPRNQPRPQTIYWTDPYYDEAGSKALMMTVDAIMYAPNNDIIGLATVDWSLLEMTNFIQSIVITPNTKVFLIDNRSDLILSNSLQPDSVMKKRQTISWLKNINLNPDQHSVIGNTTQTIINNINYRIYFSKTDMGLILGVLIPQDEIYQEIEAVTQKQIRNGLVIIVFFILGMLILLEILFKPFQKVKMLIKNSIAISENKKLSIKPVEYSERNEFTPIVAAINFAYEQINVYTEKVEDANKAKTTFLATMSHEIRTPMNAILGYTQILSLENNLPSEYQTTIQAIDSSGKHLLDLLNDILDLTKIESGAMTIHKENIYLKDLLTTVEHMFKLRCMQNKLRWNATININQDQIIYSDKAKISQILINILGNSLKFTSKGEIRLICYIEFNNLHIEISDTGAGIRKEFQQKIFTPFTQDLTGQQKGGTGLGLTIVYKIVQLMSGTISFTSVEKEGTTFFITLPIQEENNKFPPAKRNSTLSMTNFMPLNLTALVIDDVKINCDILVKVLTKLGVKAIQASNGVEALSLLKTQQPDVLFIDIQMPVMDGFEFLERLKIDYPMLLPRTIAISANVYTHRTEYTNKGFSYYITKPFLIGEIGSTIENIIADTSPPT